MDIVSFLGAEFLGKSAVAWALFVGVVATLLVLDLGVLNRGDHEIGIRRSLILSSFYIGVALLFGGWVWYDLGADAGMLYLTGFVVEKSLALDNIFVISLIFGAFAIPRAYQHRVLFWGILGVLVLRAIMIGLGAALISSFGWILYFFGAFLIITGIKMLFAGDEPMDLEKSRILKLVRRMIPVSPTLDGHNFFTHVKKADGKMHWVATPLFLALVSIEIADIVFAVDSVPAVFAITTDPYIVYTSNIFAILGLRALYFALAAMVHRFDYLKYALALVLVLVGGKIFWTHLVGPVDTLLSLGSTLGLLGGGVILSLWKTRRDDRAAFQAGASDVSTRRTQ
ncbi:TerC family protein [Kaistia nematophila]|uniref:TerC family protein n=1 Tax=Kaistia nematophila TaxID=2994654 RepID=A0A9X3E4A1_9HYPH|nr:TerC family protein [Kaistia nematophila]MCX5571440.1 TerC family protein [Kaistia nematophila]